MFQLKVAQDREIYTQNKDLMAIFEYCIIFRIYFDPFFDCKRFIVSFNDICKFK